MSVKLFIVSLAAIAVAAAVGIFVALQFFAAGDVFVTLGLVSAGVIVVALVARFARRRRRRRWRIRLRRRLVGRYVRRRQRLGQRRRRVAAGAAATVAAEAAAAAAAAAADAPPPRSRVSVSMRALLGPGVPSTALVAAGAYVALKGSVPFEAFAAGAPRSSRPLNPADQLLRATAAAVRLRLRLSLDSPELPRDFGGSRRSPAAARVSLSTPVEYPVETFTPAESERLRQHFTNLDEPVFALVNLPETVKGALFARYSRYPGTLRRLFLDEFADSLPSDGASYDNQEGGRAADFYERIFVGYGDDSIAQLGGAHVACEWVSNVLTKVLQRPRLGAYLEQSTRYIAYDSPIEGTSRYRYYRDDALGGDYERAMDEIFGIYSASIPRVTAWAAEQLSGRARRVTEGA